MHRRHDPRRENKYDMILRRHGFDEMQIVATVKTEKHRGWGS